MKKYVKCLLAFLLIVGCIPFAYATQDQSYILFDEDLILGLNSLEMEQSDISTLYRFTPPAPGIYTFTSDAADAEIGYWGTTYYIHDVTGNEKSNTLTYTITETGPTILIGISGISNCTLTVIREEYTAPVINVVQYENRAEPTPFSLDNGEHLIQVDVNDTSIDAAVMGTDGFYHLNTPDGPLLLLSFSESIHLRDAQTMGQLTYYSDATTKYDCNQAMEQYISCAEASFDVYPLTEDLAFMVQNLAEYRDWYSFLRIQEGNWLFNCFYIAESNSEICPTAGFQDVINPAWYHHDLDWMVEMGLMNGKSDTLMDPDGHLTRAELVQLLYNIAGKPEAESQMVPFSDVCYGDWFFDAIAWAYNQEIPIVNGISETFFDPNSNVTREQVAVILHRYSGCPKAEGDLAVFEDQDCVSSYAVDALIWAVQNDIIRGISLNGKVFLEPNPRTNAALGSGLTTRAQAAVMLYRYLQK